MKSAIIQDNRILIKDCPKPLLEGNGAIIKVLGCGLCGSDIVKFREKISPNGTVLGHEIVGVIEEIKSETDFKVGDKIVMGHHVPCFECVYCQNENYSMCRHFKKTNIFPGGFAEYIFASEEHLKNTVHKIPDNLTEVEASYMEPLGCIVRAVERAKLKANSKVLVIGLGSIGLLTGQCLKTYGMTVFGSDLIEDRIKIAKELNFDNPILFRDDENFIKQIKDLTDGFGVDAVFMTSGSSKAISSAVKSVRDGGKIVVFSSIPTLDGYTNNEIYYRELNIIGSYSPAPKDLCTSLNLLKDKKVIVKNISALYNLVDIEQALSDTVSNKILKAYIKI